MCPRSGREDRRRRTEDRWQLDKVCDKGGRRRFPLSPPAAGFEPYRAVPPCQANVSRGFVRYGGRTALPAVPKSVERGEGGSVEPLPLTQSAGGISQGSVGFKLQLSANPMQLSAMTAQITAHRCNRQQRCGRRWDRKSARGPAVAELWRGRLAHSIASGGSEPRPGTSLTLADILPISNRRYGRLPICAMRVAQFLNVSA